MITTHPTTSSSAGGSGSSDGGGEANSTSTGFIADNSSSAVSGTGGGGGVDNTGCGDGVLQAGEVCDDGNSVSGDGCSADCKTVEQDFACPVPGEKCVSTVVCGDGLVTGTEQCDDGGTKDGDGCTHDCKIEPGWQCTEPGRPCVAAECGDGIVAGDEDCDDGQKPPASGDGCSATCHREFGWACPTPGQTCHKTVCGDGTPEGDEPCDDGNDIVGDGCNPFCEVEPSCKNGPCTSSCGDGLILPGDNEECDDGNTTDGDGCSHDCKIETGFKCTTETSALPTVLDVPITFRDFVSLPLNGSTRHPDFEIFDGGDVTPNLVKSTLGADGKPQFGGICDDASTYPDPLCPYDQMMTTEANFNQWYNDVSGVNIHYVTKISLNQQDDGSYFFPTAAFFPLDGLGWVAQGDEDTSSGHNFGFTSEVRTWFEFEGGEHLAFSGDDDVWVFINGRLALDLGGLHIERSNDFTLDDPTAAQLNLTKGKVYEIDLFHAERHTTDSNFNLTLDGFVHAKSTCTTVCGDGIVAGHETCDDGVDDGSYNGCTKDCQLGPRCGDAQLQTDEGEQCDDGKNLANYSFDHKAHCAPGCVLGAYCGDGKIQSLFGEQCDDGKNDGTYGGCKSDCTLAPRCGDNHVDAADGEECDDGNTVSGDGCSSTCKKEVAS